MAGSRVGVTESQHGTGSVRLPGVSLTEGFPATNPALRLLEFDPETFVRLS